MRNETAIGFMPSSKAWGLPVRWTGERLVGAPGRRGGVGVRRALPSRRSQPRHHRVDRSPWHGLPLGDITEIQALTKVFGDQNGELPAAPWATVKSMIGHLLPASGSAGAIKAALALYYKILPANAAL